MQYTGVIKMIMRLGEVFLRALGKPLVKFLSSLGDLTSFILKAIYHCFVPPFYFKLFFKQVLDIGFYSLPVVGLTTLFAGMVIALQTYSGFSGFKAESVIASVVLISVTRELAPVLSALMVAGRIGAAMAAEIGTMRVTEQIDALVTLSTNPFKYLVAPRLWAGLLVLPLLVLIGDIIGIFDPGIFGIGDSLSDEKLKIQFEDFPVFPPEIFARVQPKDSLKRKQFEKGIVQLAQEGAIQVFRQKDLGIESFIVGVVGSLQLEVLEYRLLNEYSAQLLMNQLGYSVARWVYAENEKDIENLKGLDNGMLVYDKKDRPVILVNNEWALNWILDRNPNLQFLTVPSDVAKI